MIGAAKNTGCFVLPPFGSCFMECCRLIVDSIYMPNDSSNFELRISPDLAAATDLA